MTRLGLLVVTAIFCVASDVLAEAPQDRAREVSAQIDAFLARHWDENGITPAELTGDSDFLRRVTLDLLGRIPTYDEAIAFAHDANEPKRPLVIGRLLASPEYPLHFGNVLDAIIQGKYAGDEAFIAYLRRRLEQGGTWDELFREMMLGPWETDEQKPAREFLAKRINDLDDLTNDTARVFFGVEISCAKCHDHPLVFDWTQHHYYGMESFFSRTYAKRSGSELELREKDGGDVSFVDRAGEQHTAKVMFLSGRVVDEPDLSLDPRLQDRKKQAEKQGSYLPPGFSRREQLVASALEQREFFSRAVVNQVWNNLLGRGFVSPVDQMHSENPPSVEGVLEWLADDLSSHHYDLNRLIAGIVGSRAYQLSSRWLSAEESPAAEHFAKAAIRPLTPQQFAFSLAVAAGDGSYETATDPAARRERYREMEKRVRGLIASLDPRTDNPASTTTEALFMSNNEAIAEWLKPGGANLVERLAGTTDADLLVETAVWTILSRAPDAEERALLADWVGDRPDDRVGACGQLVWALVTSAEFRFNH